MADLLIKHLKKKAEEHSALSLLQNQWGFDEKLIPKALQSIGSLFPHYSRHDESHSKQILINIERLLGDSIQYLTATDTWLLLEAAYWHDIGMVVPQSDIEKALGDPDFSTFLFGIKNDPHHELYNFVEKFNPKDMPNCFSGAETPLDAMDKFRQLMSEWFRRSHECRSNNIAQNPWESVGISSPRTELIPARLYRLLGRICESHGQDFKKLMAELPFSEAGLAQEDCHPRFIACMLRLGDLLDLDDNRFCPVMQRIAGDNRPALSKTHEAKHAAIRHLRLDTQRIEVSAECERIDEYLETSKWFDWLRQEVQNQQTRWKEIAPGNVFGSLPTLGELVVSLHGETQILDEGKRPEFSIDSQSFTKLVRGQNFYTGEFVWVRELFQNAVDATLLGLWLAKNMDGKLFGRPDTEEVKALLASRKIGIELIELSPSSDQKQVGMSRWRFTISDGGTGISKEDLRYLLIIGGSHKNIKRQKEINEMPEWMKPSGAFGIGLKSAFLASSVITMTSKSMFTNETIEITLHDPNGEQRGLCTIKSLPNNFLRPYGTTVAFNLDLPKTFGTVSPGSDKLMSSVFLNQYDPILKEYIALGALNLGDMIEEYIDKSILPIEANLIPLPPHESLPFRTKTQRDDEEERSYEFFPACNGHCLKIKYSPTISRYGNVTSKYRGQAFKTKFIGFPGFNISVNILSGKAGEWLTANRENLKSGALDDFIKTVLAGLECAVNMYLSYIKNRKGEEVKYFSLSLAAMALMYGGKWQEFSDKVGSSWLDFHLPENEKTIRELFRKQRLTIGVTSLSGRYLGGVEECSMIIKDDNHLPALPMILDAWRKMDEHHIVRVLDMSNASLDIKLELKKMNKSAPLIAPYDIVALRNRLLELAKRNYTMKTRYYLPDHQKWKKLHLKEDASNALNVSSIFREKLSGTKAVVLPFLFGQFPHNDDGSITATPEKLKQLCEWVKPKLVENLSISDILAEYKKLIMWIDEEVMEEHQEIWSNARGTPLSA